MSAANHCRFSCMLGARDDGGKVVLVEICVGKK